jgi:hypothetical protein
MTEGLEFDMRALKLGTDALDFNGCQLACQDNAAKTKIGGLCNTICIMYG